MGFFQEVDEMSIFERHVTKLESLETTEAMKILRKYRKAREELKAQLLMSPDNTFTEAKLKSALIQVEMGIAALNRQIRPNVGESFRLLTEEGIENGAKELNALEKKFSGTSTILPIDVIIESTEPENLLLNNFESSIEAYGQGLRSRIQNDLTQSLLQKKTWTQTVWDMESRFNMDEWMLARIVRTELHSIYNTSKMNGFSTIQESYIPDLMKTLYHPLDTRTGGDSWHANSKKLIVPIDDPFVYTYKGKTRVFMTPPDRPNDRAILIPYRPSFGE